MTRLAADSSTDHGLPISRGLFPSTTLGAPWSLLTPLGFLFLSVTFMLKISCITYSFNTVNSFGPSIRSFIISRLPHEHHHKSSYLLFRIILILNAIRLRPLHLIQLTSWEFSSVLINPKMLLTYSLAIRHIMLPAAGKMRREKNLVDNITSSRFTGRVFFSITTRSEMNVHSLFGWLIAYPAELKANFKRQNQWKPSPPFHLVG